MKVRIATIVVATGLLLAGCAADSGPRETSGAVIGGVAGGLLGNAVGRGDGRVATTLIGAILGAIIGASIGRDMDERDREFAYLAAETGLRYNREERWRNPDTGYHGRFRPVRSYARGPRLCRDFEHTIWFRGRPELIEGTACRTRSGEWQVIG